MATRIRKLARELDGSPGEVLGLLEKLGFARFRSPDDMLNKATADRVRKAWGRGVRGVPVPVDAPAEPSPRPRPKPADDLMAQLVPGVVREPARAKPRAKPKVDADLPLSAIVAPEPSTAVLDALRDDIARERRALDADRAAHEQQEAERKRREAVVAAELAGMEQTLIQLQEDRANLEQEQQALLAERDAVADLRANSLTGPPLARVFEARGLRGFDEMERAIAALAKANRLRELLPHLAVTDPERVRGLLADVLVLFGGEVPDALPSSRAGVQVGPDRAEVPGWEALARDLSQVGAMWMLHGFTQVQIIGGLPHWQRLLREAVDPRIQLRFVAEPTSSIDAQLWVLWGGNPAEPPPGPTVIRVPGDGLVDLVRGVRQALAED